MISAAQALGILLAHGAGDYIVQTDTMAQEKTHSWRHAIAHAVTYGLPYLVVTRSPAALAVIVITHAVIDRYRLARHLVWFKNNVGHLLRHRRPLYRLADSVAGYPPATPVWMATWLMIIADNIVHLIINTLSVMWL